MKTWLQLGILACIGAAWVGCGGDNEDIGSPLQEGVHILNPGYLALPLTKPGQTVTSSITLVNIGKEALVISNVTVTGQDTGLFTVGEPTATTVNPRQATAIPVTFHPSTEGAYVANVNIASNDSDIPNFIVDLLGPSADNDTSSAPKLYAADKTVSANVDDGQGGSRGVLRYYNVGAESLVVTKYAFGDPAHFSLAGGTLAPGGDCTANGLECGDVLFCRVTNPDPDGDGKPDADAPGKCALSVPTAVPIVLDIYYTGTGNASTTFTITPEDSIVVNGSTINLDPVSVTVNGSRS